MFKLFIILSLNLVALFQYSEAVCGVCNVNNGVACISKTEFYACFGGLPNTTVTYRCQNPNEICTRHGVVCMDTSLVVGVLPACGDISKCGICENVANGGFSCTSRTTFTMCMDDVFTETRGTCPPHKMCDVKLGAEGKNPCVPDCNESKISYCDLKDPIDVPAETTTTEAPTTTTTTAVPTTTTTPAVPTITTTTEVPTTTTTTTEVPTTTTTFTPTPPANPADFICSQQSAVGRYPYLNDTNCRSYVYCYLKGNVMQATPMICPGQLYFNPLTRLCNVDKPQGCI